MATPVRIKRSTGSAAPATLLNAELSYSEGGSGTLFIGVGTGGENGTATSVVQVGGAAICSTITTSRAAGVVFAGPASGSSAAPAFRALVATDIPDLSGTYLTSSAAGTTYAPINSPTFTGTPASVTPTSGDSSTKIATTAFVASAVSSLVNGAPEALNTLAELSQALNADASFSTTISTTIGGKLAKASNLSDLADVATARTNLGLSSMAQQSSSNVSIAGGSIDGVTLDGGTY